MLPIPTADIARVYQQHPNSRVELEARFGTFTRNGFQANVGRDTFNRVQASLSAPNLPPTITRSTDYTQDDIRKTVTIPQREGQESQILWMRKNRLWQYDINHYGIRLSMSLESEISPVPEAEFHPTLIRNKNRYSYPALGGVYRIDLTEVSMEILPTGESGHDVVTYEIEIEVIDRTAIGGFSDAIERILRLVQDTLLIYTTEMKANLINYMNQLLGGRDIPTLDSDLLVQARNLQLRDLVWGGLVGNNQTPYTITHKTDGIRKLLVFAPSGIWLVMAPSEAALLSREEVPTLTGTVLDGELVPPSKRLAGAPRTRYWYLIFDCLASVGDPGIQNRTHHERMVFGQAIASRLKTDLIQVDAKTFVTLDSTQNFFSILREFFSQQPQLGYKQDGFMFTPDRAPYNPYSQRFPLDRRVLTKIPDLCKWKPKEQLTIDFQISWRAVPPTPENPRGRIIELCSTVDGQPAVFIGTDINAFSPEQIDQTASLTQNLPQGSIVEYRYDFTTQKLVPVRVRTDKVKPNRMDIARSNWDWIHDPIEASTMIGQSFELIWKYHNRIKRSLYNSILPTESRPSGESRGGGQRGRGRGRGRGAAPSREGGVPYRVCGSNETIVSRDPGPNPPPLTSATLLDIGSGRGGDVSKWRRFRRIVAVEPDTDKITELMRRANLNGLTPIRWDQLEPNTNLNDYRILIVPTGGENSSMIGQAVQRFLGGPADVVSLMLSMTFFWQTSAMVDSLVTTIRNNIKPSGNILFMTLDGDTVRQMFDPAIRGLKSNHLKLGPATLEFKEPNTLLIDIPNTIVQRQTEWLVHLTDLALRLPEFTLAERHRATTELFLTPQELLFTQMYSFGYFRPSTPEERLIRTGGARPQVPEVAQVPPAPVPAPPSPKQPVTPKQPELPTGPKLPIPPLIPKQPRIQLPLVPKPPAGQPIQPKAPLIPKLPAIPFTGRTVGNLPRAPLREPMLPTAWENPRILKWLPTYVRARPGDVGDDLYQPLVCTWYRQVVRIAALGDGNCFIHAVAKGFFQLYQNSPMYRDRTLIVAELRRDLAETLAQPANPAILGPLSNRDVTEAVLKQRRDLGYLGRRIPVDSPQLLTYEAFGDGIFVNYFGVEKASGEPITTASFGRVPVSFSLEGLQQLIGSDLDLGNEVYQYVADMLGIDIYILEGHRDNVIFITRIIKEPTNRTAVVVLHVGGHYEVVAIDTPDGFQTAFEPNDPFLIAINLWASFASAEEAQNRQSQGTATPAQAMASISENVERVNELARRFDQRLAEGPESPWIQVARTSRDTVMAIVSQAQQLLSRTTT